MGYNVSRNPIGTVHNTLLASVLGKETHPLILSTLYIHGGQVNIDRDTSEQALIGLPCILCERLSI